MSDETPGRLRRYKSPFINETTPSFAIQKDPKHRMSSPLESSPVTSSGNTFRFKDLVLDIQIYIISYFIPSRDLKSLSLVSRDLKSLAIPALYNDVRLVLGLNPPLESSKTAPTFTDTLESAQQKFISQSLLHVNRTNDVRTLAWQLGSTSASPLTSLFPLLTNLRKLHLIDPHPTSIHDLHIVVPPLFPRITQIMISGTTALSFVLPALHSPHGLTSISLDVIQPQTAAIELLKLVTQADMPNLKSFSLRALVKTRKARTQEVTMEDELFSAWREALSAVRTSVEKISLGFRTEHQSVSENPSIPLLRDRFMRTVMPIFSEGKWPKLKCLRFEGIDVDSATADTASRLRRVADVVLVYPEVHPVPRFWNSESVEEF